MNVFRLKNYEFFLWGGGVYYLKKSKIFIFFINELLIILMISISKPHNFVKGFIRKMSFFLSFFVFLSYDKVRWTGCNEKGWGLCQGEGVFAIELRGLPRMNAACPCFLSRPVAALLYSAPVVPARGRGRCGELPAEGVGRNEVRTEGEASPFFILWKKKIIAFRTTAHNRENRV
jgi:hypothetical protein